MEPTLANPLVSALWIVVLVAIVVAIGFGIILAYHWYRFSDSPGTTAVTLIAYTIGSIIFVTAMLAALTALAL